MKINQPLVRHYLEQADWVTKVARNLARNDGYKFRDAKWVELASNINPNDEIPGQLVAPDKRRNWAAQERDVFVFTSAQNNTKLHDGFWNALMLYVDERNAALHVSRFVYNKNSMAAKGAKTDSEEVSDQDDIWYDPRIEPYVSDESLQITDSLVWCGELNILPTRVHPLSTLKTYTRGCSGIVPHVKMRMDSVATMKSEEPVFMYTTGTVTQRNYIQRQAGQVADFHHVFGALVVEVDRSTGTWWARQLNAETLSGSFYDVDRYYMHDCSTDGCRALAITHGDIHGLKADMSIIDTVFDEGGVLDQLMPFEQYMHDTIDFMPRNHHNIKDPHFLWEMHSGKTDVVEDEFEFAADFILKADRQYCKTYLITSNHDVAILSWLKNTSAFYDPPNAEFWLRMNLRVAEALRTGVKACTFKIAVANAVLNRCASQGKDFPSYRVIAEDESKKVLGTDIEAGLHGHLGPSGARGNPLNLRPVGKANTGHTHSAGIVDGIYTAGVYGKLDMGYNKGLSAWSPSMIVTYQNGKRAIFTIKQGKAWRDQIRIKQ